MKLFTIKMLNKIQKFQDNTILYDHILTIEMREREREGWGMKRKRRGW